MQFTKANNTYFAKPKDDVKDRIELEIGDSKTLDKFHPQQKIMRWDNEVNVSLRLVHDEKSPKVSRLGDKITWDGDKVKAEIYPLDEAQEFEITLKEKPTSNVVQFTLVDKGVEYFYQPELTQEEKDNGDVRPENVVGSYEIFYKNCPRNYTEGKEYKTGKVGHVYRPKIIDSVGTEIWGELHIEKGILSVTIPQGFLDKAVYPVRHAAGLTFGYTTQGGSSGSFAFAEALVKSSYQYTASTGDTSTLLSLYVAGNGSPVQMAIFTFSGGVPVTNLVSKTIFPSSTGWASSSSFSQSLTNTTTYCLAYCCPGGTGPQIYYTSGSLGDDSLTGSGSMPSPTWSQSSTGSRIASIYATYTSGGGGGSTNNNTFRSLLGVGR